MMANYEDIFNARGDSYVDAHRLAPDARNLEADVILERLRLGDSRSLIDMPAGGGFLADEIDRRYSQEAAGLDVLSVEPSPGFAARIHPRHRSRIAPLSDTGLTDGCADRISSLAGLHHIEDKQAIFAEMARILGAGGLLVVADVGLDESNAVFLNDTVDRYSETGHKGLFFAPGELASLARLAGLKVIEETLESYHWTFPSRSVLVHYCRELFGLEKASLDVVEDEIERTIGIVSDDSGASLPWSLRVLSAEKI